MIVNYEEAGTQLQGVVDCASKGEAVTVTRDGKPVARVVPVPDSGPNLPMTLEELQEFRKGHILGPDLTIKQLIEEGRR